MSRRLLRIVALTAALMGVNSCALGSASPPTPQICDGIGAELGGCREDLPEYTGADCRAVAEEYGAFLDVEARAVLAGPEGVDGEARSVRLRQAVILLAILAERHLDEVGRPRCDASEFLEAAEPNFSDELRDGVGAAMYDGRPMVTYEEWLADVETILSVVEEKD